MSRPPGSLRALSIALRPPYASIDGVGARDGSTGAGTITPRYDGKKLEPARCCNAAAEQPGGFTLPDVPIRAARLLPKARVPSG
jgi:hypothetical protein